jgi:hypothetical protein
VSDDNKKRAFFSWSQEEQMNKISGKKTGGEWSKQTIALKKQLELEQNVVRKMLKRDDLEREEWRDKDFVTTCFRDISMKGAKISHIHTNLKVAPL